MAPGPFISKTHHHIFSRICAPSLSLFPLRGPLRRQQAHPGHPGPSSHLKTLSLTTPAKSLWAPPSPKHNTLHPAHPGSHSLFTSTIPPDFPKQQVKWPDNIINPASQETHWGAPCSEVGFGDPASTTVGVAPAGTAASLASRQMTTNAGGSPAVHSGPGSRFSAQAFHSGMRVSLLSQACFSPGRRAARGKSPGQRDSQTRLPPSSTPLKPCSLGPK